MLSTCLSTALSLSNPVLPMMADLDTDGTPELVTVGLDAEHQIIVCVGDQDRPAVTLNLGSRQDINGPRERVELRHTPAAETGVPLIEVFVPGGEYCGSGEHSIFVSYRPEQPEPLALALELSTFYDSPFSYAATAQFHPEQQAVTITENWNNERSEVRRLELVEGVFSQEK